MKTVGIILSIVVVLIASLSLIGSNDMAVLKVADAAGDFIEVSGVSDHGQLDGLDDIADHAYTLLKDGTRNLEDDLLVESDKAIGFRDTNQRIQSSQSGFMTYDAETAHLFRIGASGSEEKQVRIVNNRLIFTHAEGPEIESAFAFSTVASGKAEIDVEIDGTNQLTFAFALVKPVLDDHVVFGTTLLRFKQGLWKALNPSHPTNPSSGQVADLWYNETTKTHRLKADDALHNIVGAESLATSSDAVANTSSKTYFSDTKDIAANSLVVGACYEFFFGGILTTDATIDYRWTLDVDSNILFDSDTNSQTAVTNEAWFVHGYFTVRSIGASGLIQGNGVYGYPRGDNKVPTSNYLPTCDTTQILTIRASVQMSVAGFGKSCTLQQFIVKKVS